MHEPQDKSKCESAGPPVNSSATLASIPALLPDGRHHGTRIILGVAVTVTIFVIYLAGATGWAFVTTAACLIIYNRFAATTARESS